MKKLIRKISVLAISVMCALSSYACSFKGSLPDEEDIDPLRTQIHVFNFNGGYGSDWLMKAKARFEDLHKDDVYEEGKKGVQIVINNDKTGIAALEPLILDGEDEIYFTEYVSNYYSLINSGIIADITDAVQADMSAYGDAQGVSIESKLTKEQKEYLGVQKDGAVRYYGIPHYAGYTGLTYNVDLFETNNYYYLNGHPEVPDVQDFDTFENELGTSISDYFVLTKDEKRSAGPNGEYGDYDDGLPATYAEFYFLCERISRDNGVIPVLWNGKNNADYLGGLMHALVTNYEGLEQMMLHYNFDGTAVDLGTIQDGKFVEDETDTVITSENGYELSRQAGKYYALEFLETIISNPSYWYSKQEKAFNTAYTHLNAQRDFINGGIDGKTSSMAMLVDGCWWQSEAKQSFTDMVNSKGEQYSQENRNFAFMPLPKANADKLDEKNVLNDHIYSMCFMKSNVAEWKKPLALDFIKFCYSDESLVEFTTTTNAVKALDYKLDADALEQMTPYGRSLVEVKENSTVVYPYSSNEFFLNKQSSFTMFQLYKSEISAGYEEQYYATAKRIYSTSAEDYFSGLNKYWSRTWSLL